MRVFQDKLKVIWDNEDPKKIIEAFIDNTVFKEEVIHKIVEVHV